MGLIGHIKEDEILYNDPELEIMCRRHGMGITDIDDFGCEVTDNERIALFAMKQRIRKRTSKIIDEEIKRCVYKMKTGRDL